MIKGKLKERLSISEVRSRIDAFSIYSYYLGEPLKLGKMYHSPFPGRRDSTASLSIKVLGGDIHHVDHGDTRFRGDCIDFVQQRFTCTLREALQMIDKDFGLGIQSQEQFPIRKAPVYKAPKLEDRPPSVIQFSGTFKYNAMERSYWEAYKVGAELRKREGVYGVRKLWIDKSPIALPTDEPVFAYYDSDIQKVKIYRPFADKKKKEWKWRSTIPYTHISGLQHLRPTDKLVVAKSFKDRLVLLNFLDQVLSVQGESVSAITDEALEKIRSNAREIYIGFGSDPQGKEQSQLITSQWGLYHVNMPDAYLPLNDFAEVAKHHSLEAVIQHFKDKHIIP